MSILLLHLRQKKENPSHYLFRTFQGLCCMVLVTISWHEFLENWSGVVGSKKKALFS